MSQAPTDAPLETGAGDGVEVCANIGPRGRRMRRIGGWVAVGVGVVAAAALIAWGVAWPWRALLLLPLYAGAVGVLQARGKT